MPIITLPRRQVFLFIAVVCLTLVGCGGGRPALAEGLEYRGSLTQQFGYRPVVVAEAKPIAEKANTFVCIRVFKDFRDHPEAKAMNDGAADRMAGLKHTMSHGKFSRFDAYFEYQKRTWYVIYTIEVALNPDADTRGSLLEGTALADLAKRLGDYFETYPTAAFLASPRPQPLKHDSTMRGLWSYDWTMERRDLKTQDKYFDRWELGSDGITHEEVERITLAWQADHGRPYNETSFPVMQVWTQFDFVEAGDFQRTLNAAAKVQGPRTFLINKSPFTPDPTAPGSTPEEVIDRWLKNTSEL